ncbi:MAG: VWA domain-containing protein [Clostridia bacterium]|nr:VWA domain-containing protein [Clostridia bacterium]
MKQKIKLRHRLLAGFLAIAMLIVAVPVLGLSSIAPTTLSRVSDPSTMNNWTKYFGSNVLNTENAGGIWTDKSVFTNASAFNGLITMDDPNNNFLVALSAIASNKSIVGYSHIPTDTMLVLDVSGSMNSRMNDAVDELVAAANLAIKQLQETNRYNRVGVVLYSRDATVLLPLGRYAHNTDTYLVKTNKGSESICINDNVTKDNTVVRVASKQVTGATYIQSGIYTAMEELLAVEDTTIEGDGFQAGTTRMPIMVLMSDGAPTLATDDFAGVTDSDGNTYFGNSNIGDGSSTSETMGFLTQLTASYAKGRIEEHYGNGALFYTLGMGVNDDSIAQSVMNPKNSTDDINSNWEAYLALEEDEYLVLSQWGNNTRSVALNKYATEQYYVDQSFSAANSSQLETVFQAIVQQIIIQSLYYPTLVSTTNHTDGYIQFIDDIGDYMEVKSVKGIVLGNTLFSGALLAQNFQEGGGSLGTVENPHPMGDEMVWAVIDRLGIDELPQYDTYDKQVAVARELINMAYQHGQLSYTSDTEFSNYIGWYADANGAYLGFWDPSHSPEEAPAGAAYVNKSYGMLGAVKDGYRESDMMYISIQVHTEIATGHSEVLWKIPASLVPVVTYNVSLTGTSLDDPGNITVEIDDADPIRLVFEVGLRSDITALNIVDKLGDAQRNEDGTYTFYTNAWSQAAHDDDTLLPSEAINTVAFFEPSEENERYYYNENTTVYQLVNGEYVEYTGSAQPSGDNFYRQLHIFHITDAETGAAKLETTWEAVTAQAQAAAKRNEDNTWYVPKGTVRRTTADIEEDKVSNVTGTLPHAFCLGIEQHIDTDLSDGDHSYYYADTILGNNGKLTVSPATGIVISKTVDETVTNQDAIFTFNVKSEDVTDGGYLAIYEAADGTQTQGLVTFTDGVSGDILLKAGESVYIVGVDAGDYTVTEDVSGDYKVKTINGAAANGETSATVTVKTHELTDVVFENTVKSNGNVIISKTVEHPFGDSYEVPANLVFEFEITVINVEGTPRANTTYHTATGTTVVTDGNGRATVKLHAGQSIRLNDLYETDIVTVREVNLPAGFTAEETKLSVSVSSDVNKVLAFVNTYSPTEVDPVNVTVNGTKELEGRVWLDSDAFEFELQRYDRTAATWKKIGVSQTATKADPNFDFTAVLGTETYTEIGTYHYRIVEVYDANDAIGGVSYDTNPRYFNVIVTDSDMDGELEIAEVTSPALVAVTFDDTTNTWNADASFTNRYAPAGSAGITISINKIVESLNGAEISLAGFEFGLYEGDNLMGDTVFTAADGTAQIKLVYNAPDCGNTYTYILKELPGAVPGMTYTDTVYIIEVTVVDNLDGTIGAVVYTANADDSVPEHAGSTYSATFTNTYDLSDATVTIEGNKVLTGRPLIVGGFTFNLFKTDSTFSVTGLDPIATTTNKSNGTFAFDALPFDKVGTYYYAVTEQAGNLGGITYDDTVYRVTVRVTDNGDGTLIANVITTNGDGTTAPITFRNYYDAEEVDVSVDGTKTLTGRDLVAGEFSFGLYETDSSFSITGLTAVETVVNTANGGFSFTDLTFDAAGTYHYVVVEEKGNLGGVAYDSTVYHITVTVTDDGEGKLHASVAMTNGAGATISAIEFKNGYTTTSASVPLKGNKTLTGRALAIREFGFVLYQTGSSFSVAGLTPVQTVRNAANGSISFTDLSFDRAGVYYYVVAEEQGDLGGITYDSTVYRITVTVTDNGKGELIASVDMTDGSGNDVDEITFRNVYTAAGTTATLSGNKTLNGRELAAGEFSFELYKTNSDFTTGKTRLQTVQNAANGKFVFDALSYDTEGIYYYVVTEKAGNLGGITYDSAIYRVTVTVKDNGHGQLVADVAIANESNTSVSAISFTNVYTAGSTSATVHGNKVLSGRPLTAGEFSFELYQTGENFNTNGLTAIQTQTNTAGGHFIFDPLAYESAGTYYYVIAEKQGSLGGVTYDGATFRVTVTVTDNGAGELVATVAYADENGKSVDAVTFNNTYTATSVTESFSASKVLNGRDLKAGEFSFALYQTGSTFSIGTRTPIQIKGNTADGAVAFDKITYTSAGTYYYVMTEQAGSLGGVAYDAKIYHITVTVTDNGKGALVASKTVTDAQGNAVSQITFTNTYTAASTSTTFEGNKILNGQEIAAGNFHFELYSYANGFSGGKTLVQTVKNGENGAFVFDAYTFTKAGTYYFEIVEKTGTLGGVTYDKNYYRITVTVEDNGEGALVVTRQTAVDAEGKNATAFTFTNTYKAAPTEAIVSGTKVLTGRDLVAGEFSFELYAADKNFAISGDPIQTVRNAADGKFAFEAISYDTAGTYYYVVSEKAGTLGGVTYDSAKFYVTVTVTDDGAGQLSATVSRVNQQGTAVAAIRFNNRYTTESAQTVIGGNKALTGRTLHASEFEFNLYSTGANFAVSGDPIQITHNTADGSFAFHAIPYDTEGTYYYVVTETKGVLGGVTYDSTVYHVTVTVKDNGKGTLIVTQSVTNASGEAVSEISFSNSYSAGNATVTLSGIKALTGRDLKVDEFIFLLYQTEADFAIAGLTELDLKRNGADGSFTFDALTFDKVGTYYYVVVEEGGTLGGVTYDSTVYRVTVTVTDNQQGQLVATVRTTLESGTVRETIRFANTYTAASTEATFEGKKTLNGREQKAGEFSFELYETGMHFAITGTPIQTKQNAADGSFAFDAVPYTAAGTYYYAVVEKSGHLGGVTYDDAIYHVTVTVRDNGEGQLVATTALSDEAGNAVDSIRFVNAYTAESTTVDISGSKTLTGRELAAGEFSFELYKTDANFNVSGDALQTKSNTADGTFAFTALTFDTAGTYYYAVVEQAGALGGVTYDATVYRITVTVTDNGEGKLIAATTISNGTSDVETIGFTNIYVADSASLNISGTKALEGRTLKADEFTFALYQTDANFTVSGDALQTKTNTAGGSFIFDAITFDAAGTYYYAVVEQAGALGGVTYDSTVYHVTVKVTDNGKGELVATVDSISNGTETVESIIFTNQYVAKGTVITLGGTKILVGRDLAEGEFTFQLFAANESFEAVGDAITATNAADGSFTFEDVAVDAAGTYRFLVTEVAGDLERMTYDTTVYQVTVTVTDDGEGNLKVTETLIHKAGSTDVEPAVAFVNTYTPKPVDITVDVKVEKTVQNLGNVTMTPEGFEFLLQNTAGGDPISVTTDLLGNAVITLTFTEDDIGKTYTYELSEVKGSIEGMTWSEAVYTVTVTISLDETTNTLVADLTVNGEEVDSAVAAFENVYDFDEVPQTGDNLMLWITLLAVSCGAILTLGVRRKRHLRAED